MAVRLGLSLGALTYGRVWAVHRPVPAQHRDASSHHVGKGDVGRWGAEGREGWEVPAAGGSMLPGGEVKV